MASLLRSLFTSKQSQVVLFSSTAIALYGTSALVQLTRPTTDPPQATTKA